VVCGSDGVGNFDALHRRGTVAEAVLHVFDLLELNSKDQRPLPLSERRAKLDRLLDGSNTGIAFNEHTEEDGAIVFRHACRMGLEGIVSKRLTAPYRSGPVTGLAQDQEPGQPGDATTPGRDVVAAQTLSQQSQ
jgi:bifunctional non-homologous end joining protein LigD